jgi:hypothetical protein
LEEGKIHFIFPKSGKYKGLPVFVEEQHRKNYKLQLGDLVERELMNGDYVMFNRQPTLHKQSMMGYQVVLHDELTIGLHIAVTRPHNADKPSMSATGSNRRDCSMISMGKLCKYYHSVHVHLTWINDITS